MTSPENAYKEVKTVEDLSSFMSFWQEKLKPISENSVFDTKGSYYIKTKKGYPFGKKKPIELISESQFFHIANKFGYPKDTDKGIMDTIARIAEFLAVKKIMQILVKYKQQIPSPLLQFCAVGEHALYDIYIPYIDMYIDVKSVNIWTKEVDSNFRKRANNEKVCYFTHRKHKEKNRVLNLIQETEYIDLQFYAIPFAINIPSFRYHKIVDGDLLTPVTIEGSTAPGINASLRTVMNAINSEEDEKYDLYYRIMVMDKTEKEFLKQIKDKIKTKINE